jgi:hypothetical protein
MGAKLGESGWNGSTHLLRRRSATLRCLVGLRCGHLLSQLLMLSVRLFTISYIVVSWLVYRRLAVFDVRVAS